MKSRHLARLTNKLPHYSHSVRRSVLSYIYARKHCFEIHFPRSQFHHLPKSSASICTDSRRRLMAASTSDGKVTRIMVAINKSSAEGYPHASTSSRKAFEETLNKIVRSDASGFEILLLHVLTGTGSVDTRVAPWPQGVTNGDEVYMFVGLKLLGYFVDQCRKNEVAYDMSIKEGDPAKVICAEVKRLKPDILVVGGSKPSHSFLQKIYESTVSGYCTKHADCQVFVFKGSPSGTLEYTDDD